MSKRAKYLEILSHGRIEEIVTPIKEDLKIETPKETIVDKIDKMNEDNSWRLTRFEIDVIVDNVADGREPCAGLEEDLWKPNPLENFKYILKESITGFFCDAAGEPYVIFKHDELNKYMPIKGAKFREHLQALYYHENEKTLTKFQLNEIVEELAARATFSKDSKKRVELNNRIAEADGKFYYSLGNEAWQAVEVSAEGWRVVSEPPIFTRHTHQRPQVIPRSGGKASDLLQLLPVNGSHDKLLLLVFLIASFIPNIAKPILAIFGEHGSGKSTLAKMLKRIIDPTDQGLTGLLSEKKELAQLLDQSYAVTIDNLSVLNSSQSDMLCRAVTGGSFQKRRLHTDSETIVFNFKSCVILNGIDCVVQKPDLLDRSILIELQRIDRACIVSDSVLEGRLHEKLSETLGCIFDIIARAIHIYPGIRLETKPRMAGFAEWGYAIAEAIGIGGDKFMAAYQNNIDRHHNHVAENNQLMACVTSFISSIPEKKWSGRASELYSALLEFNKKAGIMVDKKDWPKNEPWLVREINKLRTNFEGIGINLDTGRTGLMRRITIESISNKMPSLASLEGGVSQNPINSVSEHLEVLVGSEGKDEITDMPSSMSQEPEMKVPDDGNDGKDLNLKIAE